MKDFIETDEFPRSLLNESLDERYKYFQGYSVAHPALENSFNKLKQTILFPSGKQLVFIIGPPGVGKTFLQKWTEDEIKSYWAPQQHLDPGRIPVAGIEVPSKDKIKPSAGDIYLRLLRSLEEPLIDKKVIYGGVMLYHTGDNQIKIPPRTKVENLRYALEKCCHHRKPFFLSFDEAQHLVNLAGLTFEEIIDWLKSLANMCEVLFCLFGTYEMYDLLDLSDQTTRRSKIIHLRRYNTTDDDLTDFKRTILSFQRNLPFEKQIDLLSHSDYLYERTAGCVGNLYDWLLAAVNIALYDSKADSLEYRHLRACVPLTALQATKMNKSISEDEESYLKKIGEDDPEMEDRDNENNGQQLIKNSQRNHSISGIFHSSNNKNSPIKSNQKKRKSPVGKRNPKRDSTGRNHGNSA